MCTALEISYGNVYEVHALLNSIRLRKRALVYRHELQEAGDGAGDGGNKIEADPEIPVEDGQEVPTTTIDETTPENGSQPGSTNPQEHSWKKTASQTASEIFAWLMT